MPVLVELAGSRLRTRAAVAGVWHALLVRWLCAHRACRTPLRIAIKVVAPRRRVCLIVLVARRRSPTRRPQAIPIPDLDAQLHNLVADLISLFKPTLSAHGLPLAQQLLDEYLVDAPAVVLRAGVATAPATGRAAASASAVVANCTTVVIAASSTAVVAARPAVIASSSSAVAAGCTAIVASECTTAVIAASSSAVAAAAACTTASTASTAISLVVSADPTGVVAHQKRRGVGLPRTQKGHGR